MIDLNIILPSKPKVISEVGMRGTYEIEGLYPGYGQTLGNSLRRVILSSMVGTAVTSVKIKGADHEFSTMFGVKEDAIMIILNLKQVHFKMVGDGPQTVELQAKGAGKVTAASIKTTGGIEVVNPEVEIATLTDKNSALEIELVLEKGIGYVPKEVLKRDRSEIGRIFLDASFTPVRRVSYEVENMRVGDRTDYNRLRINIETDGMVTPHEALEKSIEIMINQLKAIVGFKEEMPAAPSDESKADDDDAKGEEGKDADFLKTRVEDLGFSSRVGKALTTAGIRTVGGLARKKQSDLLEVEGLGAKGFDEIKDFLAKHDIELKD